jgi:hypothetical protein
MPANFISMGLVLVAFVINAGQSFGAESFADFLNRVERRDSKTKAICEIRSDETVMLNPKVEVKDNIATFDFSRSFKTGDRTARFQFPVTEEVSREVNRINNYHEMISLMAKVEAAINAYRVFDVSDCRIRVGDTLEKADIQMGITRKVHKDQGQWVGRIFYIYEDGLIIDSIGGIVQGARRDTEK